MTLMTDDQHPNSNTDAANIPAADGTGTASEVVEAKELHEVLNEQLGTTYTSPEDALSGLKQLRNFTGKAGKFEKPVKALMESRGLTEDQAVNYLMENITQPTVAEPQKAPEPDASKFVSRTEFEEALFYKDNPELAEFKPVLNALAQSSGKSLPEAAKDESFLKLYEGKKANDQTEQSKSVLHSNPRLGVVQDKMTQATEALKAGNQALAETNAVTAVLESIQP